MWIEYLFCFGQMSFWLFEFRNIGKFGDYLVDNVLKIEKIYSGAGGGGGGSARMGSLSRLQAYDHMGIKGRDFTS